MPSCGHCRDFTGTAGEVIAHQKKCSTDPRWAKVVKLREEGDPKAANRKAKRLLGVKKKGKPMTEETKEYLRQRRADRAAAGVGKWKPRR